MAIAGASNVVVRIDLRPVGLAALAAGVALIAAAAAIWPARYATRLRPTDALGYE
jgi:ABC-type antimicrobial peptide transport system permease subunit